MAQAECPKCPSLGKCLCYQADDKYKYRFSCEECGYFEVKTKKRDIADSRICPFCHKKHDKILFWRKSSPGTGQQESDKTAKVICSECGAEGKCYCQDAGDPDHNIDRYTFVCQGEKGHTVTKLIKGRRTAISRHTYCPFCKKPSFRHQKPPPEEEPKEELKASQHTKTP